MDVLLLPLFFVLIVFPVAIVVPSKAADDSRDCPIQRCRDDGPDIKFPFRLKHYPPHCGHPEFEVVCSSSFNNLTMMKLSSSSGLLPIQNIDYEAQSFSIYDADGCLPRRLLNFTISTNSLFQQAIYYRLNYYSCMYRYHGDNSKITLLNCSTAQNFSTEMNYGSYFPVRCLSVPGHYQVIAAVPETTKADLPVPTCTSLRQLYLPLRRVNANMHHCEPDNVLWLLWDLWDFPACQNCNRRMEDCYFNYSSNEMLKCHPFIPPHKPRGHISSRHIIVGVSLACCFVLVSIMAVAIFFYVKQQRNSIEEKENQMKVEKFLNDHKSRVPTRYSYADIKKITNGFKKKLGEGGFGSVFRGKLPNGVPVAVKVLSDSKGNGDDFINEVGTIGRIHHVNVVRLLGFSAEAGKRAVIYELMPNRSLEKFISSKDQSNNALFDWEKLDNIVNGIAKGIEYLHQGCEQRILHFDIKPHNILLDHDFNPKISDFGVAKLCSKEDSIISMTAARGTVGYIAPEVFNGNFGSVSHKSDVYSFGMLVLEIVGARKEAALTSSATNEGYFPELIYKCLIQGEALGLELIKTDEDAEIGKKLVIVALWCIQWYPVNRPSMKAVVRMLEGASENLIMPPNPFASATSTQSQTEQPKTTESS
ncbi:PREDICTED: rust resistance kinase Lr10-like [Prunus mume]|uniref:Rust resistance kinase Lr10-like n=1 Tax=Prunus mume TaxID=102107 RepID=A0ABM0N2G1_PRUMU|nr:PREDICTED: rust resistance kinase Lr10-like [Prunus mume]